MRELLEREQYWTTGPIGQGGISEAFAKRLYDFMNAEEGKFIYFSLCMVPRVENLLSWSLKWNYTVSFCCGGMLYIVCDGFIIFLVFFQLHDNPKPWSET